MQAARIMPRLSPAPLQAVLRERRARLDGWAARLDGASYEAVLARGFALVRDRAGHPVARAAAVKPGARLRLRFADGEVAATVDSRMEQGSLPLG
jgi:exodeoxyribonuclease VII large subunit